uniref:SWIM-type domain-containing protein n=1 Tax=Fagus sylvatica TaxID=28930 RepID=A0A2N9F1B3_FAGSY
MAPITIYIRYNGEIIYDSIHGVQYEGMQMKNIRVKRGISFKKLRRKIFNALELDNHSNAITITFRSPQAILSHNIFYMPMLINGDNDVNFMFDVLDAMPQLIGVELYITITPQLVGVDLLNIEDAQHANLEGYGGEDLQGDYNVLTQPLNTPCYDIPTPLEERGGSSYRHEHLSPPLVDGCGPNRSDENAQGVQDDHLDDVFMASQTLHDFDDVHDDYEDELCELIINDCDSHEDDDIHAQHSTPCIPTMEAPSPSFIANTWDNISVPCDDMVTPLSSWDKELEFRKGLIFSNKAEVQHAVKIYSIKRNQRYKVYESNLTQWAVYCTNECSWKLRACQRKKHGFWEITKYYGPHTCTNLDVSKDGKMLDSNLIEREIHHLVVKDHAVTIGTLDAEIFKEYKAKVSYFKLWDAKQKAIARIYGDWVKSYEILPMFMAAVQDANPNTVVKWKKKDGIERNTEIFHRVFWAFGPCIAGFIHCRPVINIDATHLYGKYQGKLLIAMGQDADNGVYPLAFAVVENESKDSWMWFLICIKKYVTQRKGMCLISDRHKGIEKTVLDKHFTDWQGSANQIRKFNTTMECIRRYNEEARIRLDEIPVERWTCSHDGGHRYGAMTTNLVECFNGVLKGSRSLPITAMVKFTFFKLANYFDDRRAKIQDQLNSGEVFSKYAMDKFNRCRAKAGGHTVTMFDRNLGVFEIRTSPNLGSSYRGDHTHQIRLHEGTCTCGKWQMFKIPCSHLIACCSDQHINVMQFIDPCYRLTEQLACYSRPFEPVKDELYWKPIEGPTLRPDPTMARQKGRPKSTRIRNEMDWRESQPKPRCGICQVEGHNRRTCPNASMASTSGAGTN